ncbi:tachykinin-like peptides receptor 86C [Macrobrachium nipponense]|uniref:tachykinin-like peptides receptor 86C n=1 Tax=Macrobrachium nipponense TaxID=159736 RepID=UPI0030C7E806
MYNYQTEKLSKSVLFFSSHWIFGSVYCTISQFMAHVSLASSVLTLAVISFDRFLNVMRPLKPQMSKCVCRMLLWVIWVVAASIAAPILPYTTTIHTLRYVVILAGTYVVPMIICYAVIEIPQVPQWRSPSCLLNVSTEISQVSPVVISFTSP